MCWFARDLFANFLLCRLPRTSYQPTQIPSRFGFSKIQGVFALAIGGLFAFGHNGLGGHGKRNLGGSQVPNKSERGNALSPAKC